MAHELKTAVTPLMGDNYPTWKIHCRMALLRENLWTITSGTETPPATSETDKYAKYSARRDRALANIMLSIDASLLYLVGNLDDPKAVWKKLENTFQKKSWANKLRLRRKLHSMQLKEGGSVHSHIREMTEVFNSLAVIDDPLSNDDKVLYLLASLPETYDVLVTSLETNENVPDIEVVTERLLQMECKYKERSSQKEQGESVLIVKNNKIKKCHHCKKKGHVQENCWILHPEKKPSGFNSGLNKSKFAKNKANKVTENSVSTDSTENCVGLVAHQSFSATAETNTSDWLIDSGATSHMTKNSDNFNELNYLSEPEEVFLGDGRCVQVKGKGTVILNVLNSENSPRKLALRETLYVPDLTYNLLSIGRASACGIDVTFISNADTCVFKNKEEQTVLTARKKGKLYLIKCKISHEAHSVQSKEVWHRRLGHIGNDRLNDMIKSDAVKNLECKNSREQPSLCESCVAGKMKREPFPSKSESRSANPLELVHSDVCGKLECDSLGGAKYFVTFTDDATRYN